MKMKSATILAESRTWELFSSQTETVCAVLDYHIVDHIQHPNNIGRCSHAANVTNDVPKDERCVVIYKKMVIDSIER